MREAGAGQGADAIAANETKSDPSAKGGISGLVATRSGRVAWLARKDHRWGEGESESLASIDRKNRPPPHRDNGPLGIRPISNPRA